MTTILCLGSYGAAVSTDDGVTWTDVTAAIVAANFGGAGWSTAGYGGGAFFAASPYGYWQTSPDGVTWTASLYGQKLPMMGDNPAYWRYPYNTLYVPSRLSPTPGTNHWHRWFVCGQYGANPSEDSAKSRYPALAMCALRTTQTPLSSTSNWYPIDLPSTIKVQGVSLNCMTFDPIARRVWVLGINLRTQNLVLLYCDQLEVTSGGTSLTFQDATDSLHPDLRTGGLMGGLNANDRQHLCYEWQSRALRLTVASGGYGAEIRAYSMICGAAYNTSAWEVDALHHGYPYARNYGQWDTWSVPPLPGNVHTPIESMGQYARSGVWTPYMDLEDFQVASVDEYLYHMLRTTAGTWLYSGEGASGPRFARSTPGMRSTAISWSTTGLGSVGWGTRFIESDAAAPDFTSGATMPMCATTTWFPHPPEFCGLVQDDLINWGQALWTMLAPTVAFLQFVTDPAVLTSAPTPAVATTVLLADAIATSSTVTSAAEYILRSLATFGDVQATTLTGGEAVADVLVLLDSILISWPLELTSSVATTDTALGTHTFVSILLDACSLLDGITDRLTAAELLTDTIVNACLVAHAPQELMTDSIALASTAAQWATAVGTIIDALVATDTATMSARFVTVCADSVAAGDTLASTLTALDSVTDEVALYVTFRIGDEVYRGYALNTGNKAASEYTNFDFNSLATVSGVTMLANDSALYALTGDDDDGTAIEAKVRTGLLAVADGKMAQVLAAYVGYASDNSLVLKAIVTSKTGEKVEHWYRLAEQTADATREGRIKLGRGLKSAYWAFEIHNVAGGTMDLDNINLHRLALDRRI